MQATLPALLCMALLLAGTLSAVRARPTIYVKNDNDKLEPVLLPVSSTVIPIPLNYYQVSTKLGVRQTEKFKKQKLKLTKPEGPIKLITVSGLKKMASHEVIKPH